MKQVKVILNTGTAAPGAAPQNPTQQQEVDSSAPYMASDWEGDKEMKFGDVPYWQIVTELLADWGINGRPVDGYRNRTVYKLTRELRYICENHLEEVMAVIPAWGLSAKERMSTINSALNSPQGTDMSRGLKAVLKRLGNQNTDEKKDSAESEERNPLPASLPRLLRYFVNKYPRNKRAVVLGALPVLGNLLTRLRSTYRDGKSESPIFMTVIVGPQASGKSFLNEMYNTLSKPILESDREQLRLEQEYKEELRQAKNATKQPEKKTFIVRCLPANVSNTQLLKRADVLNGLSIISFAAEIDTVIRATKAGSWAEKGDIYRTGFEGGLFGQDMHSESSYSGKVDLRYNLLFSGTDLAVRKFFSNVENGMMSRFCFAQMADDRGQKLQAPKKDSPSDIQFVEEEVKRLYEMGSNLDPESTVTINLPRTLRALDKWEDERIEEYLQTGDEALDILRRRSCLLGFRAAMVAWALCGCRESDQVVSLALWVASEVLAQQMSLYGEQLNKQAAANREIRERAERAVMQTKTARIFDELPMKFKKNDLIAVRRRHGKDGECGYLLTRWVKNGLVMKSEDGSFEKLKESLRTEQEQKES